MTAFPRPVSLFSSIALKKALVEILYKDFTEITGISVDATYESTNALLERFTAGAWPDVFVGQASQLPQLAESGLIDLSSCTSVARVGIGIATAGGPEPDITTVDKLITALTAARSVAYSRAGASGVYFAGLLERLGISERVSSRATIVDSGFAAGAVLDGRADIAVQLMSEHRCVPGVKIVGPLPDEVQQITEFAAVLGKAAGASRQSQTLVAYFTSQHAQNAFRLAGMEPTILRKTSSGLTLGS